MIYIYIYIERERERESSIAAYLNTKYKGDQFMNVVTKPRNQSNKHEFDN
jgi:hypothetical protein